MAFFRAIAQPNDPLAAVAPVVLHFFVGFGGNARGFLVHRLLLHEFHAFQREGVKQHLSDQRVAKVAVGPFHEEMVLKFAVGAEVGESVFVTSLSFNFATQFEPVTRLSNQVQGEVAQGNVFFEDRSVAAPCRQALPQHQGVVTEPHACLRKFLLRHGSHVVDLVG